jgi:cell division protein FtsA
LRPSAILKDMQKTPHFVGLDIGTANVRCIVGMLEQHETENTLSVIGVGTSQNHGMRKGAVVHVEDVAQAIDEAVSEAERMAGVRISGATINVNGAHINSQPSHGTVAISNPNRQISDDDRLRAEETAAVVHLPDNREIIQVFSRNYKIDGQDNIKDPVGMQGVRLEVDTLVVTAGTPLLRTLDSALEKAQVNIHHHTISSLAAAEAVLDRHQKESGTAIIDIGAGTTNLVVLEEGEIEYLAVIPIGSKKLTDDLAIGLKTDLEIAEQVKLAHANLDFSKPPAEFVSIEFDGKRYQFSEKVVRFVIEARMEELFEQIDREFKKVGKSRKLPGGVVLVGATAKMPGLAEYAKERLQLAAKVGTIKGVSGLVDTINSPEYATGVGLMMLDMILDGQGVNGVGLGSTIRFSSNIATKFKKIIRR